MQEADIQILPGRKTRMLTYNGSVPGPTIVARRDRPVSVTYHNQLAVSTTVHNHGAYVSGDSDGHPADAIVPGATKTCFYPNAIETPVDDVTSHTQWYHDHVEHATALNVYTGGSPGKETVRLGPNEIVRVIMKWPPIPANGGILGPFRDTYVFHCNNLEHEDHDRMLQFRVIS